MMKSSRGITLVALTITIIILFILIGIGMRVAFASVNEVIDNQLTTELGIVRQAIVERYSLAQAVNQIKVPKESEPVSFWLGERIEQFSEIALLDEALIKEDVSAFYQKGEHYQCNYQEDFYYRLTPENLSKMGVGDAKHTYIVNYKTAEVYNETKKVTSDFRLLYLPSTKYPTNNTTTEDKVNFNDWD